MQAMVPPGFSETFPLEALRYVLWVLVALSALATLFLRTKVETAAPAQRGLLTLVGWTFGEGVALLGVVLHFAGGAVTSLALGVIAFVFALLMLPVPPSQR
jgi:FtsH-binding integral membrane protein